MKSIYRELNLIMYKIRVVGTFLVLFFFNQLMSESAVTYLLSGGRFGDNLIAYFHAKWVSYKFNIPILIQEFKYSNQLVIHQQEKKMLTNSINEFKVSELKKFKKIINFERGDIPSFPEEDTLYIIPYFSEILDEYTQKGVNWPYFKINWNDRQFKNILKKLIAPINKLNLINIPTHKISIAIHLRTGRGYEENLDTAFPLKSPHLNFYINSIKKIVKFFKNKPLFIFIFSDDPNPEKFVDTLRKHAPSDKIEWAYRKNNFHDANVLEDFFNLINFDCIIRSESNFSLCASKLTDYLVEISPQKAISIWDKVLRKAASIPFLQSSI